MSKNTKEFNKGLIVGLISAIIACTIVVVFVYFSLNQRIISGEEGIYESIHSLRIDLETLKQ